MAPRDTTTDWQVNYAEIKMRSAHLLRSHEWADCAFEFETGVGDAPLSSLKAHRLILAMASPVFAAMFYGHVGDKEKPVKISDIDQPIFSSMLDYIYTDEVEITSIEFASSLLRAANKYFLVHLERKCINYLRVKLCPQNVCHIYELSCMFNEIGLRQKCEEMFSTKTLDILKASSFKDAQLETLRTMYSLDSLNINSELDLLAALLQYTKKAQCIDEAVSASGSQENRENCELSPLSTTDGVNKNYNGLKTHCACRQDCASAVIHNTVRQRVSTLIAEIRFLNLSPEQFAECQYLHELLSEKEILALCMNISSTKTVVPMPAGFSISRMIRNEYDRNHATFRFTVHKFSGLTRPVYSTPCYIRNLPWTIKFTSFEYQNQKYVAVYLECKREDRTSNVVTAELRIFTHKASEPVFKKCFKHKFCRIYYSHSFVTALSLFDLLDPERGYIENDSITLEVHMIAEATQRDTTVLSTKFLCQ